jgi:hypothetical protein
MIPRRTVDQVPTAERTAWERLLDDVAGILEDTDPWVLDEWERQAEALRREQA